MGYFGKALAITPIAATAIDGIPAWEFMNQTGSLGTYLAGSAIYVGDSTGAQTAVVIVAGTTGAQNAPASTDALTITTGGTGYTTDTDVATTTTGDGSGLKVSYTAAAGAVTVIDAITATGSGYSVGDIVTINVGGANATLTITAVRDYLPVAADAITFDDVQPGSILPVKVDYVLNSSSAGGFIAMRNET